MKERLDLLLVKKNLASSREKAKAIIMSGIVYVDGQKEDKAGALFEENKSIEIRGQSLKYVSRGGLKLEKALTEFDISLSNLVCMDVGASTGGFTDCMLQNGASKVFAVDVGYGQLDWKLRNDERVAVFEKTNIRYLEESSLEQKADMASIDVSFISLSKVLPALVKLLKEDAFIVALIKPQFEAGREKVGKKGVVREAAVHVEVIQAVYTYAADNKLDVIGLTYSPIKGPEGNIEYLCYMKKNNTSMPRKADEKLINTVVNEAHTAAFR